MAFCKKCNKSFKKRVWIDGQFKDCGHRVHCFDCVPFNSTRNQKPSGIIRHCKICNKDYIKTKSNRFLNICNSCKSNKNRHIKKQILVDYKGGCCQKCGYKKCIKALVFHHLNEKEKEFNISGKHTYCIEKLKKEVDKCLLVCHNCHSEIHDDFTKSLTNDIWPNYQI